MLPWLNKHVFPGGIHPPEHKAMSTGREIQTLAMPDTLYLPLRQHAGQSAVPVVNAGDHVVKGQLLAKAEARISAPVHAPTSGVIRGIEAHPVPHPSGLSSPCLVLDVDGLDHAGLSTHPLSCISHLSTQELIQQIHDAGIVGLGGAAFPAAVKMATPANQRIDTLLINGAECEPYITCDDMLMQTQASKIWQGIHLLCRILKPHQCVLAIEDNKPQAIRTMRQALQLFNTAFDCPVSIKVVPTLYPTGGEKQLIKTVTGHEVPSGKLPLHVGVVCQNVATAKAVADAIVDRTPLLSRLITVTGNCIRAPGNYQVLLGTPIQHVIRECGGVVDTNLSLTMGGPMMGMRLHSTEVPVVKGMNCLLIRSAKTSAKTVMACIRCGNCARACPMSLLPQQLYRYAKANDFDKAKTYALADCIECGCCEYVCPSNIPLVQYYRFAKAEIRTQQQEKLKSDLARQRHERRQQRLEAEQALKRQKPRRAHADTPNPVSTEDQTVNI
jgi:electron transport complex protein RnfC